MKTIEYNVHNHGPFQKRGLDCPERVEYGRLRGACLKDWQVCKREGQWRVYDRGSWLDSFPTLKEAHTYATQSAVANILFEDGGLTTLKELLDR